MGKIVVLRVLPDLAVQVFNQVGGVDDLPDFNGEVKEDGQLFPVVLPAFDSLPILAAPLGFHGLQASLSSLPCGCRVDVLHVMAELTFVFPDYVAAAIADLVEDTDLDGRLREHSVDGLGKTV